MEETRNGCICSDGEEDRISRLTDELIHHIMDTKYAVQTSLLSKRWIHVWKSLPFLNFNNWTESFLEFVYFVFISRYDATIRKFTVEWHDTKKDDEC